MYATFFRTRPRLRPHRQPTSCRMCIAFCFLTTIASADDWTRFRGPNGSAAGPAIDLPSQWPSEAVQFRKELPGVGVSSPVIIGDRLFITSAEDKGQKRHIICLDSKTGSNRWQHTVEFATHKIHGKNSYATATITTDGRHVFALFADEKKYGVYCLDIEGKPVWERDLGPFVSQHGNGASPILHGDLLIVPNEQDGKSAIVALNKSTGQEVWSLPRRSKWTSYATPMVIDTPRGEQLIILSTAGLAGVDPKTGKLLWNCDVYVNRTVSSPVFSNGLVIGTSGERGKGILMIAARTNGVGEVASSHIPWKTSALIPYCSTPVAVGGHLYAMSDSGILLCLDAKSGKECWHDRVDDKFTASPVAAGERIFFASENGNVFVVAADAAKFRLLGKSKLDDAFEATPALAGNSIYLRGEKALWRLGVGQPARAP